MRATPKGRVVSAVACANAMHITAPVFINDGERSLHQDYKDWLEELAPHGPISHYLTTAPARTTATPTSSSKSWAARSS